MPDELHFRNSSGIFDCFQHNSNLDRIPQLLEYTKKRPDARGRGGEKE